MREIFANGYIADVILIVMAAEGLALFLYWRATGRSVPPCDFLLNLVSGFFLILALRAAMVGGSWGWTAAFLAAGGLAHAADLRRRWRR
jgi:hypothetical protein